MNEAYPVVTEEEIGRSLSSAIDLYGPSLLRQPERLRAYLEKHCPDATVEIAAIVAAIVTQVPQAMLAADADDDAALDLRGLVERIVRQASLDRRQARWVVRVWARALAVSTRGLDREPSDERVRVRVDARASAAEVLRVGAGMHAPVASAARPTVAAPAVEALDVDEATIESAAEATAAATVKITAPVATPVVPSPVFRAAPAANHHAAATAHVDDVVELAADDGDEGLSSLVVLSPPAPEPIVEAASAGAAAGLEPVASPVDEASAARASPTIGAAVDADSREAATGALPRLMRDPAGDPMTIASSAPDSGHPPDDALQADDGGAPPTADPPWMAPDGGRRRPNRLTGIAAVVGAALAVAIVLIPFARQSSAPPDDATNAALVSAPVSGPPAGALPDVASPPPTPSDATSATPAAGGAPTTGEQPATPGVDVAAASGTPAAPVAASPDPIVAPAPAATPPLVTPSSATPSPATPLPETPANNAILPPNGGAAPATVVATPSAPVASSSAPAASPASQVADAAPPPPVAAAQAPPRATAASPPPPSPVSTKDAASKAGSTATAVVPPGTKSASKPLAVKAAKPSAAQTSSGTKPPKATAATATASPTPRVATSTDKTPASGKAAAKPTAGCTRADCGSVVAVRPAPGDPRIYEMTLRMDDRSIHTLVQPLPLRPGMRVKRTGNRYVPAPMN